MYRILEKVSLNPTVTKMVLEVPLAAKKARAGQFVILRADENGERIPLTVAGTDREKGSLTVIFQVVGATTEKLNRLEAGEYVQDVAGPLGRATELEGIRRACVVGGGVGCAIALPVVQALRENGAQVDSVIGFRSKDLVILEDEFSAASDRVFLMTDDGSAGRKGLVTDALKENIENGAGYDTVFCIGPLIMMKFVCLLTKQYGIRTVVSMNPIMIDGTGMCGGCRLTVNGQTRFACVDGPDFDGHEIDFDEAIRRNKMYAGFEKEAREKTCSLFRQAESTH